MSGIYGLVRKDGAPVDRGWLLQMEAAMAAWVRDGAGCWMEGSSSLGVLFLHNTPESLVETGPHQEGDLVIVADVRLDNRAALCAGLARDGAEGRQMSDVALLLRAYRRWKTACVDHILGAFAFAIWDKRRRRLFCARDGMGCRPFFYADHPQFLAFASDPQALLALDAVPKEWDPAALQAHHMLDYRFFAERTLWQHVSRLPPAHTLCLEAGQIQRHRYWTIARQPRLHLPRPEAYAELLLEKIEEAVACRLRTAFPLGSHLSGGLDSSAVTVLAARHLRWQGRALAGCFSWSPPPPGEGGPPLLEGDERLRIDAVCAREDVSCTYTRLHVSDVLAVLREEQHPVPGARFFCEPLVRRAAMAAGIRTLLSGWGGDETVAFNGRGALAELFRRGRWARLAWLLHRHTTLYGGSLLGVLKDAVVMPLLPYPLQARLGRAISTAENAYVQEKGWSLSAAEWQTLKDKYRATRVRADVQHNQMTMLNNHHLALRMEAWAIRGAQAGVEYRFPLLDRRLIELCLQLPPDLYLHDGWSRWPLRQALAGILPASICWNPSKAEPARREALAAAEAGAWQTLAEAVHRGGLAADELPLVHPAYLRQVYPSSRSLPASPDS